MERSVRTKGSTEIGDAGTAINEASLTYIYGNGTLEPKVLQYLAMLTP